jgi:HSP20 family protein
MEKPMAITRWEPFQELERWDPLHWQPVRELERLQEQMNHLFDRLAPTGDKTTGFGYVPTAEMEETDTAILLKVEVPGMEAKDIEIEATDDTVTIRGERKVETKTEEKSMVRSEFQYGKFERMMRLPAHVKNQEVIAEYKDGILSLTLPKVEGEQKKSVKVNLT